MDSAESFLAENCSSNVNLIQSELLDNCDHLEAFSLDIGLPLNLLERCCQLQSEEILATMGVKMCHDVADAVQMWAQRREGSIYILVKGIKSSPISQLEDRWHCHITSVDIVDNPNGEAPTSASMQSTLPAPVLSPVTGSAVGTQTDTVGLSASSPAASDAEENKGTTSLRPRKSRRLAGFSAGTNSLDLDSMCRSEIENDDSVSQSPEAPSSKVLPDADESTEKFPENAIEDVPHESEFDRQDSSNANMGEMTIDEDGVARAVVDVGRVAVDVGRAAVDVGRAAVDVGRAGVDTGSATYEIKGTGPYKVKIKKYRTLSQEPQCQICNTCYIGGYSALSRHMTRVHGVDYKLYRRVELSLGLGSQSAGRSGKLTPMSRAEAEELLTKWKSEFHIPVKSGTPSTPQTGIAQGKGHHTCPECNKTFHRGSYLKAHMKEKHSKATVGGGKRKPTLSMKHRRVLVRNELVTKEIRALLESVESKDTNDASSSLRTREDQGSEIKSHICIICWTQLHGTQSFLRHMSGKHALTPQQYMSIINIKSKLKRDEKIKRLPLEVKERKRAERVALKKRRVFPCPACQAVLTEPNYLIVHIKKIHCNESDFPSLLLEADDLICQEHRKDIKAPETLTLKCPFCGVDRVGRSVMRHLKHCHEWEKDLETAQQQLDDQYRIMMRDREAMRKVQLSNRYKESGLTYKCRFCEADFKHRSAKCRHEHFTCKANPERQKSYWCRLCGKHNSTQEILDKHIIQCRNKGETFMCHLCGKTYLNKSALYVHKKAKHELPTGVSPKYACDQCGKTFHQKHHYKRHMAVHSDERSCQCEFCGKRFKTADAVNKHLRAVHRNHYPYHCNDCGHGVSKQSYLKNHRCGRVRRVQDKDDAVTSPGVTPVTAVLKGDVTSDYLAAEDGMMLPMATPSESGAEIHMVSVPSEIVDNDGNNVQLQIAHLQQMMGPQAPHATIIQSHQIPLVVAPLNVTELTAAEELVSPHESNNIQTTSLQPAMAGQELTTISVAGGTLYSQTPAEPQPQAVTSLGTPITPQQTSVDVSAGNFAYIPVTMYNLMREDFNTQ